MKLNQEQKIRIARFHDLYPTVNHQDLADLFGVARTSITGVLKTYAWSSEPRRRKAVKDRYDAIIKAEGIGPAF